MANPPIKLLIAASGTGGHLFPAIALAEKLPEYNIQWLGVPNRLETQLVPRQYPLHTIAVEGFQQGLSIASFVTLAKLIRAVFQVRQLLKRGGFQAVFTTGGYIAAPAVIAARSLGLPVVFHESNAFPGKVTRFLSRWCSVVALGFGIAAKYLPHAQSVCVGTPVRSQFLEVDNQGNQEIDLPIPEDVPVILVFGGSQGAVVVNQLVRESAPAWFDVGAYVVHLTGDRDHDIGILTHPQYIELPFYDNMAWLLQRSSLAISRAGAGSLAELAVSGTPAILIPYPFAAENHQAYNAQVFNDVGAALTFPQSQLTVDLLKSQVLDLLQHPDKLENMSKNAQAIAVPDSAEQLASLMQGVITAKAKP